ncbi:heat stress transcription factor A-4c [Brassica rapa]|uniref:heat stress transcription factor A-4c n=1 Tax=Brassica campestris TaxID=3711 RepID=UPI0008732BD4|nr:heat stress transcription factor A-4c [Brassica rapa]
MAGTGGMYQLFYVGVYEVVDDPSLDSIISWSKSNKSFVIWNPKELGFVRIKGSEHLEFGHEQYFVRGKPDLLTKMRYQAASDRMKKSLKEAKARAEAEKNGCVGDQSPISRMMNARDARIRFNKIMRSFKAKTPLENSFLHLRI